MTSPRRTERLEVLRHPSEHAQPLPAAKEQHGRATGVFDVTLGKGALHATLEDRLARWLAEVAMNAPRTV